MRRALLLRRKSRNLEPTVIQCLFNALNAGTRNSLAGINRLSFRPNQNVAINRVEQVKSAHFRQGNEQRAATALSSKAASKPVTARSRFHNFEGGSTQQVFGGHKLRVKNRSARRTAYGVMAQQHELVP
jgi:hypothetical protein